MKKLLFLLAMLVGQTSFAQDPYTLSTYNSVYTELVNATPVEIIIEEGNEEELEYWDDPFYIIQLEFGFQVGDSIYNSLIQAGGGAEFIIANLNYTDSSVTSTKVHFFGLFDDFADAAAIEGLPHSEITYNTTGDIGNRITKIQYTDAAFYEEVHGTEPAAENRVSFQVWFYEDNGIMEIHFGESNITDPELIFYDNPGPGIELIIGASFEDEDSDLDWGAQIIGDPANPTLSYWDFDEMEDGFLNSMPENGRVYRFAPSAIVGLANASSPKFSIYPTIAQSEVWIKDAHVANSAYRIMDITGKQVKTGNLNGDSSVNVSNLNTGVYIFSIEGMVNAVKFVKE